MEVRRGRALLRGPFFCALVPQEAFAAGHGNVLRPAAAIE